MCILAQHADRPQREPWRAGLGDRHHITGGAGPCGSVSGDGRLHISTGGTNVAAYDILPTDCIITPLDPTFTCSRSDKWAGCREPALDPIGPCQVREPQSGSQSVPLRQTPQTRLSALAMQ